MSNSQPTSTDHCTFPGHADYFNPEAELACLKTKDTSKIQKIRSGIYKMGRHKQWGEEHKKKLLHFEKWVLTLLITMCLLDRASSFPFGSNSQICAAPSCPYASRATQ